jgi:hypothetical protein
VTLTLDDASRLEGYVTDVGDAVLRLWKRGSTSTQAVPVARVRHVALTGRDPASGRSFATWQRQQAERAASRA